jgi:hypothetical protein
MFQFFKSSVSFVEPNGLGKLLNLPSVDIIERNHKLFTIGKVVYVIRKVTYPIVGRLLENSHAATFSS